MYRQLVPADLDRIGDIDRTERIETLFVQRGVRLEARSGDWSAPAWSSDGSGEHSVAYQRAECHAYLASGGIGWCAFDGEQLVGIGVVVPEIRAGIAQLAYLHVSDGYRGRGVGGRLATELERLALEHGDSTLVVSSTPSENTVRFYLARGFEPMAEPLLELYEREPEDVHLCKSLVQPS